MGAYAAAASIMTDQPPKFLWPGPALGLGLIGHRADRIDGDKRGGVGLLQIRHQLDILRLVDDDHDLLVGHMVIGADGLVNGRAAVHGVDDEVPHLLHPAGEDAHPALLVKAENEVVQDNAPQICTQHAQRHRLEVVEEGGGQGHAHARQSHGLAQLDPEKLVEQLPHDIQPAGGCVAGEQQGLPHADNEEIADHVREDVAGDGLRVGGQPLEGGQENREQHGGIDGLRAEIPPDEQKAQQQQTDIQHKGDDGDGQGDDVAEDNGET